MEELRAVWSYLIKPGSGHVLFQLVAGASGCCNAQKPVQNN